MRRLPEILARKREDLARARAAEPEPAIRLKAEAAEPPRDFAAAIARGPGEGPRFIAEFKRASPSAATIRDGADPADIARRYAAAGAAALSVLTDAEFFGGSLLDLRAARAASSLPALRKDFLIDPYDVWVARAWGADAVLLIVAAFAPGERALLSEMGAMAHSLGMAAVVEVHDEADLDAALAAGAGIVGINHRDLRTMAVHLDASERLRPRVPAGVRVVAESGVRTREDVARLAAVGVDAILVGEALMRAPDPGAALRELSV